jgi:hypothetical protein
VSCFRHADGHHTVGVGGLGTIAGNLTLGVEEFDGPRVSNPLLQPARDEKTQIQALDRTQPPLPLKKGRAGTMTHDYKRNGTTTLLVPLNALTGVASLANVCPDTVTASF